MLCNANPRDREYKKTKKQKNNEQRSQRIAMKHKDHIRKTQLN